VWEGRVKTELAELARTGRRRPGGKREAGEACREVKRDVCTFGLTEEGDNALQALRRDSKVCGSVPVAGVAGVAKGGSPRFPVIVRIVESWHRRLSGWSA